VEDWVKLLVLTVHNIYVVVDGIQLNRGILGIRIIAQELDVIVHQLQIKLNVNMYMAVIGKQQLGHHVQAMLHYVVHSLQ
jgi:hypothetical protein